MAVDELDGEDFGLDDLLFELDDLIEDFVVDVVVGEYE